MILYERAFNITVEFDSYEVNPDMTDKERDIVMK